MVYHLYLLLFIDPALICVLIVSGENILCVVNV